MFEKRYRLNLVFNANKVYDRQIVEGIGEYLQAAQCDWDIYFEDDFRYRLDSLKSWKGDGIIADFDNPEVEEILKETDIPMVAIGGSYHHKDDYPRLPYVATDNAALVKLAYEHLKRKGLPQFAFYGMPDTSYSRWSKEREHAFIEQVSSDGYHPHVNQGLCTTAELWDTAQQNLESWLQSLPKPIGIIAVTDSRARHLLQACDHLNILVPEEVAVIGIDNESMARYLNRTALSSVTQGCKQMGYEAAKILHRMLSGYAVENSLMIVDPTGIEERQSTDYRALRDPYVIQAMHFIRHNACRGIKVAQVVDSVGISRTNLETRFIDEVGCSMHEQLHMTKFYRACELVTSTDLAFDEISRICGYPSVQYMYTVMRKNIGMTPGEYRVSSRLNTGN
ncbi:DNA-binding transcriptional regulator [Marinomonas sp. 15G1-11]|mgnify:CR=1 FL=1|uniref:DNA-binding transcriptional regulator n=1 Tax=Marinomonas phaeophyticola TaxID=3004091 RepID=A0ABT4JP54_9GAMM|nr:DNA-binding transcriptional regulator [Marinomonas sp. 15G1-11]MCZ2720148.1 DNA-binding transcriptional regulator [Marinomonas sp. 15G1-11]